MKLLIVVIVALAAYALSLNLVDRIARSAGMRLRVRDSVVFFTSFSVMVIAFILAMSAIM